MRILVYPYKMFSSSAKKLTTALNSRRIRPHGRYRSRWSDVVINWGSSTIPTWYARIFNNPERVANATNKLTTFKILSEHGVSTPLFSEEQTVAEQWVREGHTVYCRLSLNGHSGNGIHIAQGLGEIRSARLYTRRVKTKTEYRVHVIRGRVLHTTQKRRRRGVLQINPLIRNHSNGYVYASIGINVPSTVTEQAIKAVAALGLDFGAVDIGYVEREDKAYVYEVNCAPGLEGSTVDLYANTLMEAAQHV